MNRKRRRKIWRGRKQPQPELFSGARGVPGEGGIVMLMPGGRVAGQPCEQWPWSQKVCAAPRRAGPGGLGAALLAAGHGTAVLAASVGLRGARREGCAERAAGLLFGIPRGKGPEAPQPSGSDSCLPELETAPSAAAAPPCRRGSAPHGPARRGAAAARTRGAGRRRHYAGRGWGAGGQLRPRRPCVTMLCYRTDTRAGYQILETPNPSASPGTLVQPYDIFSSNIRHFKKISFFFNSRWLVWQ